MTSSRQKNYELQVDTWLETLQRLVTPSIVQMLFTAKQNAVDFCTEREPTCSIDDMYVKYMQAICNSRDDQLVSIIEQSKDSIRQVLHSFVVCYAQMFAYKTDTICTQPITIPSVAFWYRKLVRAVFADVSRPGMFDQMDLKSKYRLYRWIDVIVKRNAIAIIPLSIFVKEQDMVGKQRQQCYQQLDDIGRKKHVRFEQDYDGNDDDDDDDGSGFEGDAEQARDGHEGNAESRRECDKYDSNDDGKRKYKKKSSRKDRQSSSSEPMPEIQSTQSILPDAVPAMTPRINLVDKDPETLQIQPLQTTSSDATVTVNLDETAMDPPLGKTETSSSAKPAIVGDLNPAILSSQALAAVDHSSVSSLPIQSSVNAGQPPSGLVISPDIGLSPSIPARVGITASLNPVTEHY